MTEPVSPENVQLVGPGGGTVIPVECCYEGTDDTGIHRWVVVAPQHVALHPGWSLRAAMLPGRSSIRVAFQPEPNGETPTG